MMYIYFLCGLIFGSSLVTFFLVKEIYVQNKKIIAQTNQIDRLEKLNLMLSKQVSEEQVYGRGKKKYNAA
jgi:hypothetical protein